MVWRTVWQRLTRLRIPPRGQPSAPPAAADSSAAAPDTQGKQRRGYQDKSLRAVRDYHDKALHSDPLLINPPGPWRVYVDEKDRQA